MKLRGLLSAKSPTRSAWHRPSYSLVSVPWGGGTVLPLENAYRFETNLLVVCCYRMARRSELMAKAEECARLAQASDEAGVKYRYMIAADEWREMAEEKRFPKKRSSLFHRRGHKRHQPSARTS